MRYIYKIFRELDSNEFKLHYERRLNSDTTCKLPFSIKPIKQSKTFPLYYIPTNKIIDKLNEIYKQDFLLNSLNESLPIFAQKDFIFDCLMEELYHTNDLEGVRSSKEEIVRSARLLKSTREKKRFSSMISSYNKLLSGELTRLDKPEDIRTIYDHIVEEEIEKEEKPDGILFRTDTTYVYKKSGSGQEIHRGITPEEKIIESINNLIDFMNKFDAPPLVKIAIGHYYFGYIHPFYDGNGRTSRFISSMYLSFELSPLTAISLSRGCNDYRNIYLTAFEHSNSIANRGELNCFIDSFFEVISNEQKKMIQEIKIKKEHLKDFEEKLETDDRLKDNDLYYALMYVLGQNYFFSITKDLTVKKLSVIVQKSEQSVRKALDVLDGFGLLTIKGVRPAYYSINKRYIEGE
ncbi:Fic family protein (plasmid) [Bacillus carboniphilus]|uniref:Fic family protein n=1 Tax=Bacillus carboniphilus TaxID=86663 RepID=A0ABY9JYE3_9BACI|nr:Fic family protein [Bacillus carboniphilus]WLR44407.1 Fic family protein [Bacillus carboniphilus]